MKGATCHLYLYMPEIITVLNKRTAAEARCFISWLYRRLHITVGVEIFIHKICLYIITFKKSTKINIKNFDQKFIFYSIIRVYIELLYIGLYYIPRLPII